LKIKESGLTNFANYDNVTLSFDPNVTYLIGKNGSGKTTGGLTGIWFVAQGIAEKAMNGMQPIIGERFRFIGPNAATAKGYIVFVDETNGAEIKATRKLTKSGTELSFEAPEGYQLDQAWLNRLFNLFLICPKKFCDLSPKDQAQAIGIDTKPFDVRIADVKKEYTVINAMLKQYANLQEVEKAEKVDIQALYEKKRKVQMEISGKLIEVKKANSNAKVDWQEQCAQVNKETAEFNAAQLSRTKVIQAAVGAHAVLAELGYDGNEVGEWIGNLPVAEPARVAETLHPVEPEYLSEEPDNTELDAIDTEILEATKTNEKAVQYSEYLKKLAEKERLEGDLAANKKEREGIEQERVDHIKKFDFPFKGLLVDDDGQLLLDGKPIKDPYFSTGELLKIIPMLLSSANPELKYVFIQGFNDLDEDNWAKVEEYLTGKGFQLVVEMVGKEKIADKNCILLKDNVIVEDYNQSAKEDLL
jgi:hypothetical protein